MRASTIEGCFATPVVTMSLPVNVFMAALMIRGLPVTLATMGGLAALPFACNLLQTFLAPFVTRIAARQAMIFTTGAQAIAWAALGWNLPRLFTSDANTVAYFLFWFSLANAFFASLASIVWNAWMHDLVPPRLRVRYFGQRNRIGQFATLLFVALTGYAVTQGEYSAHGFQLIILVAVICRAISLYYFWQMPDTRPSATVRHERTTPKPLREQFAVLRRSHSLLRFVVFGAIWAFSANCFGAFYYVFMFRELSLSATEIGVLAALSALGGSVAMPIWSQLLARHGNKGVMAVALAVWQSQNFLWCIVVPENSWLMYPMWILGGCLSTGFVLGQFTILLKLIPPEAKGAAIGLNVAITSVAGGLAPLVGGKVLTWALDTGYATLDVYHAAFLVQPVFGLLSCLLLIKIREPASSSLTTVVGAMRNIRTVSGIFGLSFLANYLFVKPVRKDSRSE